MESRKPSKSPPSIPGPPVPANSSQTRNLMYACDRCRMKKIKCSGKRGYKEHSDSSSNANFRPRLDVQACANCAAHKLECTYGQTKSERAIPKKRIQELEANNYSLIWILNQVLAPTQPMPQTGYNISSITENNLLSAPNIPLETNHEPVRLTFPPQDLCHKLFEIYFGYINIHWPLLHKPTFLADYERGRYLQDRDFACVLLAVCALAGRQCNDPRVLAKAPRTTTTNTANSGTSGIVGSRFWIDDLDDPNFFHKNPLFIDAPIDSAGWKYYKRIEGYLTATTADVTLCELQTAHLIHRFLLGEPELRTAVLGAALRRAQARGLYIQSSKKNTQITLEDELLKRAYWCLAISGCTWGLTFDNCFLTSTEHLELSMPLEVDDNYWILSPESNQFFPIKPPSENPSEIAAFNAFIKLSLIAVRLYHLNSSNSAEETTEADRPINKVLNTWRSRVPDYLNWDADPPTTTFQLQSNRLHLTYSGILLAMYPALCPDLVSRDPSLAPVQYEYLLSVYIALKRARALNNMQYRTFSFNHTGEYMNEVPPLVGMATVVVSVLLNDFADAFRPPSETEESTGSLSPKVIDIIKDIYDICANIIEELKHRWPIALHAEYDFSLTICRESINLYARSLLESLERGILDAEGYVTTEDGHVVEGVEYATSVGDAGNITYPGTRDFTSGSTHPTSYARTSGGTPSADSSSSYGHPSNSGYYSGAGGSVGRNYSQSPGYSPRD
ncbi:hypothetical protein M422DRAFT_240574 [Sphaerobolus stellatus SS14]|nr:hypothetical protein M422DRAFT_240574 [Sphaerobolus stellatus SS14]